jgi:serine/threonine-protein kinase 24/25/MST4
MPVSTMVSAALRDRLGHNVGISDDDPRSLFQLEERLGKGSFGSVYRGVHRRTGEWVAIKIISLADEEAVDDVRREISILKECENSHIVKYYGSYFEQDNLWVLCLSISL